ncbi:MAG: T9SS type A sorting domain-containing protein [Saprospiraceae bacterium]|nr:T9SS type A sorting domain-containing protein [Saprospiraceae bacterium]
MKALNMNRLFVAALLSLFTAGFAYAQPANDACTGAIAISCGQTVTGNNTAATNDVVPACGLSAPRKGVWYTITGTGGLVTLTTCSTTSNFDTQISVYSGACTALTCVASNDNDAACSNFFRRLSTVSFNTTFGTVYRIMVSGKLGAAGTFTLNATCAAVGPPNDACAGAIPVACGSTTTGSTALAGVDAVGTCITTLNTAPGVWYSVTGNGGAITVSLCGSSYDTKVGVFSGTCGALVCVTGNDDFCSLQSQVTFNSTAGTTYLILVTGFSTASGAFTMNVTCAAPPCNCTNTSAFGTVTAPVTNSPATISTCNFPAEFATINSAVAGSTYVFSSSVATDYLTVRQGTSGGTVLGCGPTPLTVTATASGPLFLHINLNNACAIQASGCRTTTVQCTSCGGPNGGAACTAATALTCGGMVSGTTVGGTINTALGTCVTALNTAPGVWHTITPASSGMVTLTTCAAVGFDTKLGVFSGPCTNLLCITGNDDAACSFSGLRSTVTFAAVGGTTYRIYVTGFSTATGAYELSATCTTTLTAPNDLPEITLGQEVADGLNVGEIFPNPAVTGKVAVRIDAPVEGNAIVTVFDNMGRQVNRSVSGLYAGSNLVEFNANNLPVGTYFVSIQVGDEIVRRKLVVVRP